MAGREHVRKSRSRRRRCVVDGSFVPAFQHLEPTMLRAARLLSSMKMALSAEACPTSMFSAAARLPLPTSPMREASASMASVSPVSPKVPWL
jgi:hypothetical protein